MSLSLVLKSLNWWWQYVFISSQLVLIRSHLIWVFACPKRGGTPMIQPLFAMLLFLVMEVASSLHWTCWNLKVQQSMGRFAITYNFQHKFLLDELFPTYLIMKYRNILLSRSCWYLWNLTNNSYILSSLVSACK